MEVSGIRPADARGPRMERGAGPGSQFTVRSSRLAETVNCEPGTLNRSAYFNSRIRMFFHATSNGPAPFLMPWT
jgi:hypothetical protein